MPLLYRKLEHYGNIARVILITRNGFFYLFSDSLAKILGIERCHAVKAAWHQPFSGIMTPIFYISKWEMTLGSFQHTGES
jgi:hypothetical protein